jgi:hypothetical protein
MKNPTDNETKKDGCGSLRSGVWFGGIVAMGYVFDHWNTIKLEQPDGYKIDLLLRFREWADSYGNKVTVKYWLTDKPVTKEQAQEGFLRTLLGAITADMNANEYSYSEYTSGVDYDTELKVGGHDLMRELLGRQGKHLWLHLSSPNAKGEPDGGSPKA